MTSRCAGDIRPENYLFGCCLVPNYDFAFSSFPSVRFGVSGASEKSKKLKEIERERQQEKGKERDREKEREREREKKKKRKKQQKTKERENM